MRAGLVFSLILAVVFGVSGCGKSGPKMIKAKGKVVKDGEDFISKDGEGLQVCFIPIQKDNSPPKNWYAAAVDKSTGHFVASGGEYKGMPPGKYRVMIELKKNRQDTLGGKFDALNSPYEFEVDEKSDEMVVDIGEEAQKKQEKLLKEKEKQKKAAPANDG